MSKYSAVFSIGWMTVNAEGDTPEDLVREIENTQDLMCLARMASTMGTKKDKQEIQKLIDFLEKYGSNKLTIDDIRNLDINLSAGGLKCESLGEKE